MLTILDIERCDGVWLAELLDLFSRNDLRRYCAKQDIPRGGDKGIMIENIIRSGKPIRIRTRYRG